eukprot:TRINITY_DN7176_c0_g1_i1.p1 TRINITY_DN7176_c0_g1~~TRINITY_DN7176_c0_g1_i1.p1  ORF type:complete len:258 (-),score=-24.59 TRINITY_DN7176_c0_g1_i1:8-781(-)
MDATSLECVICQDKLNDAHETLCCHQCYCKKCITEWMERNKTCPSCRRALPKKNIAKNVPIQRMVDNLPANCTSCRARLTRGTMVEHVIRSCPYTAVTCPQKCGVSVLRKDVGDHQASSCPKRIISCKWCRNNNVHEQIQNHWNTNCQKVPVTCPFCKGHTTREVLDHHYKKECPVKLIICPFNKFGCAFQGKRADYNLHMIDCADEHVAQAERTFSLQNAAQKAAADAAAAKKPQPPVKKSVGRPRTRGKENQVNK